MSEWIYTKEQEPTTKIDYRRAFKIACELLNGDLLYGVDTDKIYELMMKKDGVISSSSYEEYILDHLQELDQGQYASEPTTKNDLGVEKIVDVLGSYTDLDIPYKHKIAEDILNNLPPVTSQEPRWIPVSERLPDEGYSVLVMRITDDNYKYMRVATYQGDCWMDDTDKFNKPNPHKVIAWMPLPQPYREVEE